jgi:hypothetical protein
MDKTVRFWHKADVQPNRRICACHLCYHHISPYSRRNYDINLLARKQRILENAKLLLRNQNHLGTPEKGQIVAEEAIQISQSETADKPSR